jgi:hypothetical protein
MGRGKTAEVGDTRVSQNGYHYTKVPGDWRLTHHLTAEKHLGRALSDNEIVKIKNKREPYKFNDNIEIIVKRTSSLRKRKAVLESKIQDLQGELASVNKALESQSES